MGPELDRFPSGGLGGVLADLEGGCSFSASSKTERGGELMKPGSNPNSF